MAKFKVSSELEPYFCERTTCCAILIAYAMKTYVGNLALGNVEKEAVMEYLEATAISLMQPMTRLNMFDDFLVECSRPMNATADAVVAFGLQITSAGKILGLSKPFTLQYDVEEQVFTLGLRSDEDKPTIALVAP